MDTQQKISIGILGVLLLGTMVMYSSGNLGSSVLNTDVVDGENPCSDAFMKNYAETYEKDKEKIVELQQFVGRNCRGDVVESKKSYCDARSKQIETYSKAVKKYENCTDTLKETIVQ